MTEQELVEDILGVVRRYRLEYIEKVDIVITPTMDARSGLQITSRLEVPNANKKKQK